MSISANALSDEKCLHYATLDPAAAAELTRRLTTQCMDTSVELNELRDEVRPPQYADQFIELARKTIPCRDMRIRMKAVLADAKGKPVSNPKTKAPTVGLA